MHRQSYSWELCSVNNVLKIPLNEVKIELGMTACAVVTAGESEPGPGSRLILDTAQL